VTILSIVDRESIERRDFPVGRRGYDQAAVDEHLRRVADEIETLRANPNARPAPTSLSAGTSEQVRAILEAAEAGAAQIRAQAGDHVASVEEATGDMLERLNQLEAELNGLLDVLRRSGEKLNEGLARLHEQVGELDRPPAPDDTVSAPDQDTASALGDELDDGAPEDDLPPITADAPVADSTDGAALNGDEAAARLVALNMALGGTPREETARYLAEHYALADAEALLDEVYSRAGQ
jgi:DivIVA domain-containing protein